MNFIRRLNRENFIFQVKVLKFGDGSWQQMQNFNSISPNLCLLGPNTGTWGVNNTKHKTLYFKLKTEILYMTKSVDE